MVSSNCSAASAEISACLYLLLRTAEQEKLPQSSMQKAKKSLSLQLIIVFLVVLHFENLKAERISTEF